MNFAPVVDINTNPKNPIIGNRSFGENKYNVTRKASAFVSGMQDQRVLANAKHFPGHGDTESDSHKSLPFVGFDKKRIESVELYPYKKLFSEGLSSVMVAHLNVPSLDSTANIPSSLSYPIVTELLQDQMGFEGLIITDALNMKGASNYGNSSSVDLKAFQAGNDILLLSEDVARGVLAIRSAYDSGLISESRINYSVEKILKSKYWAGLSQYEPALLKNVKSDISTPFDNFLLEKLFEEAITLVKNESSSLPIVNLQAKRRGYIHLGDASGKVFYESLNDYEEIPELNRLSKDFYQEIEQFDELIIGYHKADDKFWRSYSFSEDELRFLQDICEKKDVVLTVFTSPYSLLDLPNLNDVESLVVSYQNDEVAQRITAEKLFGASSFKGKLPVGINDEFPEGTGLKSPELGRLLYRLPEAVGVNSKGLEKIDSLLQYAVDDSMTPGLVVLAARHGKIFYHKSFGSHSYKGQTPVVNETVFDLASLTKILSGTALLMRASQDGIIDLDDSLGTVFPVLKDSNKDSLILREALSHSAGIKPWIPYYLETLDSESRMPDSIHYRNRVSDEFNIKITDSLYLLSSYKDTIYKRIFDSELRAKADYKYSGLLFYLLPEFSLANYNQNLDDFTKSNFYAPLGASTLGYKPLEYIDSSKIAPSEEDDYFRMGEVKGMVHDMGAAMMGGVSGNAGLFGSAIDVAKMMQMYLQGGVYGGRRYFDASTLDRFNKRYYLDIENRRGLGFDKPHWFKIANQIQIADLSLL
jgi:beta-glucosidase-like glycosyl hydrolase/CubicO group peptidase (beta-lactamase class C family)